MRNTETKTKNTTTKQIQKQKQHISNEKHKTKQRIQTVARQGKYKIKQQIKNTELFSIFIYFHICTDDL